MRFFLTTIPLLVLFSIFVPEANGYMGTDISGDYAWSDSLNPTDPDSPSYTYTSIASTGSSAVNGDDNTAIIDIGFNFEFYGNVYSTVAVSTNGFISFDTSSSSGCCTGYPIPDAGWIENFIAGHWTDLVVSGNAYYEIRGIAPSRQFILEFNGVPYYWGGGAVTFQILLQEGSDEIYVHTVTDGNGTEFATIGFENATGTDGIQYFYGSTSAIDLTGVTVVFFPRRDAPRLTVVTEDPTIPEGGSLELEVRAIDRQGDPVTIEWDTDLDGEYDDHTGETITVSAEGLDGPDIINIGVRASDPFDHADERVVEIPVINAPPVVTNIPEEPFHVLIGEEWEFTPEVTDPGDDEITIEIIDRPVGMVLQANGRVIWTPTDLDVGETSITYLVTDDEDDPEIEGDGDATFVITIVVSENNPPGTPTIISPERSENVTEAQPILVAANPTDPEGDALFMFFELDISDSFPNPIPSGQISAGPGGQTEWQVPSDLLDGTRYYWRVWAFDGRDEGLRASSYFNVVLGAGDGDGDADGDGDSDSDGDADDEVTVEGCGCQAGGEGASASSLLLLLIYIGFIMRYRFS